MPWLAECLYILLNLAVCQLLAMQRDLKSIELGFKSYLSGEFVSSNPKPQSSSAKQIKELLDLLRQNTRKQKERENQDNRLVFTGQKIAAAANEVQPLLDRTVKTLMDELSPSLSEVAIVLSNSAQLATTSLSNKKLTRVLPAIKEQILNQPSSLRSNDDFLFLGVGFSYSEILELQEEEQAGIWLGFRSGLSPSHKQLQIAKAIIKQLSVLLRPVISTNKETLSLGEDRDFLLGLSHDIRAPGSAALYSIYNIKEQHPNILELRDVEDYIQDQLDIIDNVLDMARDENKLLKSIPSKIDFRLLLEKVIRRVSWQFQQKQISLEISSNIPDSVFFDRQHLERILQNLLVNAAQHTDSNQVSIKFLVSRKRLDIKISDNGSGLGSEDAKSIFKKFRSPSSTGGYGLGLAICAKLAQLNNSEVFYERRNETESTFTISIPVADKPFDFRTSLTQKTKASNILIIEDNPACARAFKRQLHDLARKVEVASCIEEARLLLNSLKPSLVVSDFILGQDTVKYLVNLEIPWIILTGDITAASKELPEQISLLEKPVCTEKLRQLVISKLYA